MTRAKPSPMSAVAQIPRVKPGLSGSRARGRAGLDCSRSAGQQLGRDRDSESRKPFLYASRTLRPCRRLWWESVRPPEAGPRGHSQAGRRADFPGRAARGFPRLGGGDSQAEWCADSLAGPRADSQDLMDPA
jgi:hypothetical protein